MDDVCYRNLLLSSITCRVVRSCKANLRTCVTDMGVVTTYMKTPVIVFLTDGGYYVQSLPRIDIRRQNCVYKIGHIGHPVCITCIFLEFLSL